MKNLVSKIITFLYKLVFQEKISLAAKFFVKNLSCIVIGYGIAAFCIFAFQIIGGRILGPTEYGKYVLVDSVAIFLHILMILGFSTAAIKYIAEKDDYQEQRKIISTSYLMVFIFSLVSIFLLLFFSFQLSKIFSISLLIFRLAIIFAFFYVLYTLATNTLRGLHQMKKLALFRIGYGLLTLIVFGILILTKHISFLAAVFSICFAYLVIFLLITINLRQYLVLRFDKFWANKLFRYGIYAVIGGVCLAFLPAISKILVSRYLTSADVGIYNAYYFSSIAVVVFLSTMFITVFFPTASKYQQKEPIFRKIKQLLPYLFLGGIPTFFGIELIILTLYGVEYPINYSLMLLFALTSILIAIHSLYNWLFCSEGVLGVKLVTVVFIFITLINILLSVYLIPLFALYGAIFSLGVAYMAGIICLLLLKKRILYYGKNSKS